MVPKECLLRVKNWFVCIYRYTCFANRNLHIITKNPFPQLQWNAYDGRLHPDRLHTHGTQHAYNTNGFITQKHLHSHAYNVHPLSKVLPRLSNDLATLLGCSRWAQTLKSSLLVYWLLAVGCLLACGSARGPWMVGWFVGWLAKLVDRPFAGSRLLTTDYWLAGCSTDDGWFSCQARPGTANYAETNTECRWWFWVLFFFFKVHFELCCGKPVHKFYINSFLRIFFCPNIYVAACLYIHEYIF